MPAVSVIMPAYNGADFIAATIASVLAQSYTDFELLVVDDCSTDNTVEVVHNAAGGDARVRLLSTAVNSGPAGARNVALEAARGHFMAFLDSDDQWAPSKLEQQVAVMGKTGAAISFTAYHRINEAGERVTATSYAPERVDYARILRETVIPTSSSMIDIRQTGPIRMKNCYYDDYALWLELLGHGHVARGIQQDLMQYRVRSGSWSRNKLKSALEIWKTYRQVEKVPLVPATWYFTNYAVNSLRKFRREYTRG